MKGFIKQRKELAWPCNTSLSHKTIYPEITAVLPQGELSAIDGCSHYTRGEDSTTGMQSIQLSRGRKAVLKSG